MFGKQGSKLVSGGLDVQNIEHRPVYRAVIALYITLGVLMPMIRIYIAGAVALFSLILAVMALIAGQPVTALSLALAGVYCGLGVTLGVCQSISNPLFQAAAAVIGAIGLFAVFLYHRGFDSKLQEAHLMASASFLEMETHCKPMPIELQNIRLLGVKACATQDNVNQMSATVELAKGLYFGPTLSIADSAYSAGNEPAKDYCALAYQAAAAACPNAFISLSSAHKTALLGAAK